MLSTIDKILAFLSPRQLQRAKKARKLYGAMGTPKVEDLKTMVWMHLIRNNEVNTDDVNIATRAFGPDIRAIK
eukprot:863306-Ditylum_brightwellii.AAC.1